MDVMAKHRQREVSTSRAEHTDTVEFACKDLEHDQSKAELGKARPDVRSFECALGRSNLDQFGWRQDDGSGTVKAEVVAVGGVACLEHCDIFSFPRQVQITVPWSMAGALAWALRSREAARLTMMTRESDMFDMMEQPPMLTKRREVDFTSQAPTSSTSHSYA